MEQEKPDEHTLYRRGDRDWRTEWTGTIKGWCIGSEAERTSCFVIHAYTTFIRTTMAAYYKHKKITYR